MKRSKKALSNFVNKHSKVSKMSIVFDRKNKMKEFITNPRSVLCVLKYWRAGGVQTKVCVRERDLLLKLTGTMKLKCGCQRNPTGEQVSWRGANKFVVVCCKDAFSLNSHCNFAFCPLCAIEVKEKIFASNNNGSSMRAKRSRTKF